MPAEGVLPYSQEIDAEVTRVEEEVRRILDADKSRPYQYPSVSDSVRVGLPVLQLADKLVIHIENHPGLSLDQLCKAMHGNRENDREITAYALSILVEEKRIDWQRPCGGGYVTRYYPIKKAGGQ